MFTPPHFASARHLSKLFPSLRSGLTGGFCPSVLSTEKETVASNRIVVVSEKADPPAVSTF
jgi:hypothetical protein